MKKNQYVHLKDVLSTIVSDFDTFIDKVSEKFSEDKNFPHVITNKYRKPIKRLIRKSNKNKVTEQELTEFFKDNCNIFATKLLEKYKVTRI